MILHKNIALHVRRFLYHAKEVKLFNIGGFYVGQLFCMKYNTNINKHMCLYKNIAIISTILHCKELTTSNRPLITTYQCTSQVITHLPDGKWASLDIREYVPQAVCERDREKIKFNFGHCYIYTRTQVIFAGII